MTRTRLALIATALLAAAGTVPAQARDATVRFQRGQDAATFAGLIRGYAYDRYFFSARAGQTLTATLDTDRADAILFNRDGADLATGYVLPDTGRYEIRVLQTRAAARRGYRVPYRLSVSIR